MSLLINGMEMPANCQNCFASDDESRFCRAAKKYIPMLGKPKFCPIIELPDHGDLIDRDTLNDKAEFIGDAFSGRGGYAVWVIDVVNAPVVIPAERSEASLCVCDNCDQRNENGCSVCKYINEGSEDETG